MRIAGALAVVLVPILSGCAAEYPYGDRRTPLNVVTRGTEPLFTARADGTVLATACLAGRPSGYGDTPSACALDSVMGQQVARPGDLVHPHPPGRPYAAPTARAAYEYINGALPGGAGGNGPAPAVVVPVPPDGTPDDAEAGGAVD